VWTQKKKKKEKKEERKKRKEKEKGREGGRIGRRRRRRIAAFMSPSGWQRKREEGKKKNMGKNEKKRRTERARAFYLTLNLPVGKEKKKKEGLRKVWKEILGPVKYFLRLGGVVKGEGKRGEGGGEEKERKGLASPTPYTSSRFAVGRKGEGRRKLRGKR